MAGQRVGPVPSLSLTVPQALLLLCYRTDTILTLRHRRCLNEGTEAAA